MLRVCLWCLAYGFCLVFMFVGWFGDLLLVFGLVGALPVVSCD